MASLGGPLTLVEVNQPEVRKAPVESLLEFFSATGWGQALQDAGWSTPKEAETLVSIMSDTSQDPKIRLQAMEAARARSKDAVRYSGLLAKSIEVVRGIDSAGNKHELTVESARLASKAAEETTRVLSLYAQGREVICLPEAVDAPIDVSSTPAEDPSLGTSYERDETPPEHAKCPECSDAVECGGPDNPTEGANIATIPAVCSS